MEAQVSNIFLTIWNQQKTSPWVVDWPVILSRVLWATHVDSASLIGEFPHGTQLQSSSVNHKKWRWKPDVLQQHSFCFTREEPTAIMAEKKLTKKYQTYAYFVRTVRQDASKKISCWRNQVNKSTNKSSKFSVGFRGIIRPGSAFIFLRWFKLAHICIKVTSFHRWNKQGINGKFLIGNRFPITKLRLISCLFHLWSEVTLIQVNNYSFKFFKNLDENWITPSCLEFPEQGFKMQLEEKYWSVTLLRCYLYNTSA